MRRRVRLFRRYRVTRARQSGSERNASYAVIWHSPWFWTQRRANEEMKYQSRALMRNEQLYIEVRERTWR